MPYIGSTPRNVNTRSAIDHQSYLGSQADTSTNSGYYTFYVNYTPGNVSVVLRGVHMADSDFVATTGTDVRISTSTITLASDDVIEIIGYGVPTSQVLERSDVNITGGQISNTTVAGYTPTSRSISAGSGLSGGGDLSSDRSLLVDFVSNQSQVKTALNASGGAPIYACRAWVNFDGFFGTSPFTEANGGIYAAGNVSSVTDNGSSGYTINFGTAMPNSDYAVLFGICGGPGNASFVGSVVAVSQYGAPSIKTASAVQINTNDYTATHRDFREVYVSIFG